MRDGSRRETVEAYRLGGPRGLAERKKGKKKAFRDDRRRDAGESSRLPGRRAGPKKPACDHVIRGPRCRKKKKPAQERKGTCSVRLDAAFIVPLLEREAGRRRTTTSKGKGGRKIISRSSADLLGLFPASGAKDHLPREKGWLSDWWEGGGREKSPASRQYPTPFLLQKRERNLLCACRAKGEEKTRSARASGTTGGDRRPDCGERLQVSVISSVQGENPPWRTAATKKKGTTVEEDEKGEGTWGGGGETMPSGRSGGEPTSSPDEEGRGYPLPKQGRATKGKREILLLNRRKQVKFTTSCPRRRVRRLFLRLEEEGGRLSSIPRREAGVRATATNQTGARGRKLYLAQETWETVCRRAGRRGSSCTRKEGLSFPDGERGS